MKARDQHRYLEVLAWLLAALVVAVMVGWLVADANAKRVPIPSRHAKVWVCPEGRDGTVIFNPKVCTIERRTFARLAIRR